jgi:hypothetical protein
MIGAILLSKRRVLLTGDSPFWWSIKDRAKFGLDRKTGMVVPVNDDGEVDSVAPDKDEPSAVKVGEEDGVGNEIFGAKGLSFGPDENEMGEYWEKCDELADSQTLASKMLRAARLRKLQEYTDYVLPMMEVEMLIALNNHDLKFFGRQLLITDPKNAGLLYKSDTVKHARYTFYARHGKHHVLHKVVQARRSMELLKEELEAMTDDEQMEEFMVKNFIIDQFHGFRRSLAERFLLGEGRYESPHSSLRRAIAKYVCMVLVPLAWGVMLYFTYVYNLSIGSRASTLWAIITFGSLFVDAMFLQPLRIWFRWIVINSTVASDMRDITKVLALRYVSIMQRKAGVMRDANNMIQHFNPACRVARLFPHLPVSRFLLSMNDYDVPHFNSNTTPIGNKRGLEWWIALAVSSSSVFLAVATTLFIPLQDAIYELVITMTFDIFALTVWGISEISLVFAIICLVGCIASVFAREYWLSLLKQRKQEKLAEKTIDESYLKGTFEGLPSPSKPDTYLADPNLQKDIDHTAVFESKFKPIKGEISNKYRKQKGQVAAGDIPLHNEGAEQNQLPSGVEQVSFGGVNIHQVHSNSGVVPAGYDEQAPMPVSVKRYGGAGHLGLSRDLRKPPPGAIPDGQPRIGSLQVADHIATLEQNITENLEQIIKSTIEKSTLQQRRKAAKRRRLRVQNADLGSNLDAIEDRSNHDVVPVSARRSRKKSSQEEFEGPGLSARGAPMENVRSTTEMLDASSPALDFSSSSRKVIAEGEEGDEIIESNPMLGKFPTSGPGAHLKPVPLGEEFIARKEKKKIKPDVTVQFPAWH